MGSAKWTDWTWASLLGAGAGLAAVFCPLAWAFTAGTVAVLGALGLWLLARAERWPLVLIAAALVLPPLPLPFGDSGVHPALVVAAAGGVAGLLRLRAWEPRLSFVSLSLVGLIAVLAFCVPVAALLSGPSVALGSAARIALLAISIYTFFYLAQGPGRAVSPESLLRTVFGAGLVSAAFALLDFYFQFPAPARFAEQFVWLEEGVFRRAQGTFYEASTLACLCVFLLSLSAGAGLLRSTRTLGVGAWPVPAAALLCLTVLVLSFSRTAVVSLAAALAALAAIRGRARRLRGALAGAVFLAAGLAGAAWLFPAYFSAYALKLRYSGEFLLADPNSVLSRRVESWRRLLDFLAENPERLFVGLGYKTLPYTEHLGRPIVADNMYLSLLVETGWPGLAALLLVGIAILARAGSEAARAPTLVRRTCGAAVFAFWCGFMLQMFSGDVLTYWRILPAVLALLALGERHESAVPRPVR